MPLSPPSSQSSTKRTEGTKKKKKSWSLEGKNKKGQPKSRQQIKAMLLAKEKIKEEDLDAPPNSDAKDDSQRIFEQSKYMPEKEEYVRKPPQIAIKRQVKKKGNRRAETVRIVRKNRSRTETPTPKLSREEAGTPVDTTLFKERASANNSNANSPDNSDRQRQRERERRRREQEDRTQDLDQTTPLDSEGAESSPLPLAREPTVVQRRDTVEKPAVSRMAKSQQEKPRGTTRSVMGMPTPFHAAPAKSTGETSTQLALEPEPDLDRVRRQKEAAFMKRFLTALKLLPNTAPPRPTTPVPRSEDSPSDSSKRQGRSFMHNPPHNTRKHPK